MHSTAQTIKAATCLSTTHSSHRLILESLTGHLFGLYYTTLFHVCSNYSSIDYIAPLKQLPSYAHRIIFLQFLNFCTSISILQLLFHSPPPSPPPQLSVSLCVSNCCLSSCCHHAIIVIILPLRDVRGHVPPHGKKAEN